MHTSQNVTRLVFWEEMLKRYVWSINYWVFYTLLPNYDWFCNLDIEPKNMWRRDDMETYSSFTESSKTESAGHSDYTTHKGPVIRLTTRKISKLNIISL